MIINTIYDLCLQLVLLQLTDDHHGILSNNIYEELEPNRTRTLHHLQNSNLF